MILAFLLFLLLRVCKADKSIQVLMTSAQQDPTTKNVAGRVKIGGNVWEMQCKCPDKKVKVRQGTCNPALIKIFRDKKGSGLETKDVRKLLGDIKKYNWAKVSTSSFMCVDGRVPFQSINTPGGDAGEFILALHTYQNYFGSKMNLTEEAVDRIFKLYLTHMKQKQFTMCTDDQAIEHIEKTLTVEGIDLSKPRVTLQKSILTSLMEPMNNGDLHLRLILKYHSMYSIDIGLVKSFIKVFYTNLWNNHELNLKLNLETLMGPHNETAFLEIKSNAVCTKDDLSPLFISKKKDSSVFYNHVDAVQIRRAQLANFFANVVNMHQDPIDTDKLFSKINQEGLNFLEITGSYLGKELPFYSVNIL